MKVGIKILDIRKTNNMTQNEFANLFGVSRQAVSNWENNKSYPDLEIIIKISDNFGVSLDQLLKEDLDMVKSVDKNKKYMYILKAVFKILAVIFIIGLIYVSVCQYQYKNMYNSVIEAGFKNELTREFVDKYGGFYVMTEAGVDYLVHPKTTGKFQLDTQKFWVVARKGENDITLIIDGDGEITLALYPGEVQINEKGNMIEKNMDKYTDEQGKKIKELLQTREKEVKDIVATAVQKWKEIN